MNYLGIDWGEKRIGLASQTMSASPCHCLPRLRPKKERMRHIEKMLTQRKAEELVVGYPLNMNGTVGFKAKGG